MHRVSLVAIITLLSACASPTLAPRADVTAYPAAEQLPAGIKPLTVEQDEAIGGE